jgi:hypothetical protein
MLPSGSFPYASQPTPGIGILGSAIWPPFAVTAAIASSTFFTPIVFTHGCWGSCFGMMPPLMPGSPSAPVVTSQYGIPPPSHFWTVQPNMAL